MKQDALFKSEEAVLKKAVSLIEAAGQSDQIDKTEYISLLKSYKKLFKQLKLLVKMGDIQQNKLNKLNEKLDRQNLFIKKTFGRYLSDDIVECILESPQGSSLGGEKRVVTIVLTDIRGFTAITERESAENIVGILNIYLETMTEIIFKHGGTIDEFIGDSILVIFGAPVKSEDHADTAVTCAIEMQQAMAEVNQKNREMGYPEIEMGIGINTGELIVGNIGSEKRAKYAVVGSHVNLTSRIESYTVGDQILISESTMNRCKKELIIDSDFEIKPKGMTKPIRVFEVGGISGDSSISTTKRSYSMITLERPVPIAMTIIQEKHSIGHSFNGEFIKLGPRGAELTTGKKIDPFSNLKISVESGILTGEEQHLYGKIMNRQAQGIQSGYRYNFYFTSVPEKFGEKIKAYE